MKKRTFSQEFKEQAVLATYESSVKEVGAALGISLGLLYYWRRAANLPVTNQRKEIKRLQRMVQEKELELEILNKARSILVDDKIALFEFIKRHKSIYPIMKMCRVLGLSSSTYYRRLYLKPTKIATENKAYLVLIKESFEKSKKRYGAPRITADLRRKGFRISRKRVQRLMRANNLICRQRKKYVVTTDSNHTNGIAPNLLPQKLQAKRLNEVWVSDITYIHTNEGWLYLTTIMDLYNREIIGWALSQRLFTNDTVIPALKMAQQKRTIQNKLIFHSDRGVQYASTIFKKVLLSNALISQSMSRLSCCWDNAVAESFFKTLKTELMYGMQYKTIEAARLEIIEIWYNMERLHSSLGYKTPCELGSENMSVPFNTHLLRSDVKLVFAAV